MTWTTLLTEGKRIGLILLVIGAACLLFLWQSHRIGGMLGFPLDDSWIHARFADNLAQGYGFAHNRGTPSPGSTSPLWVILLSATYFIGVPPIVTAYFWGILLLVLSCWITYQLTIQHGYSAEVGLVAALLTATMARLVLWGALSGMEVSLYVFLTMLALLWHVKHNINQGFFSYLSTIALALAALARPECYVLFPLAWLDRLATRQFKSKELIIAFLPHILLYVLILLPNWLFNYNIIGSIFPSTFHAKVEGGLYEAFQAGDLNILFAALTLRPLNFLYQYVIFMLENNVILFIPALWGFITLTRHRWQQRQSLIVPFVALAYPLIVSTMAGWGELVGRQVANLIPLYCFLGVVGAVDIIRRVPEMPILPTLTRWAYPAFLILAFLNAGALLVYSSSQYGWMVENINAAHVGIGRWVAENTQPDDIIATHDVGAIGYFGNRRVIDIVGLVTPEIIPHLKQPDQSRDENILDYLRESEPDYLIVFPLQYPELITNDDVLDVIYQQTHTSEYTYVGGRFIVYRFSW